MAGEPPVTPKHHPDTRFTVPYRRLRDGLKGFIQRGKSMSDRLFVASRKGLFTVTRRGADDWQVVDAAFLGDNVTIVYPDVRDGWVYAALDHGHFGVKLHRSCDGGKTWEECGVPVYPQPPEGSEPEINAMSGAAVPWNLKLIWALEGAGPDRPGALWCGTVPGGLFRSDDRGTTWEMVRSLWENPSRKNWFGGGLDFAGIHSICVDPRDSKCVALGVSCGGVWITEDEGATWSCRATGMWAAYMPPDRKNDPDIQDPHRLVRCDDHPDAFWVQHHNGVFRSVDGAASWQEVKNVVPSTFGFAVAVHPQDSNTAWFVPAIKDEKRIPVDGQLIVARTRNGGASFDVLRQGLPQSHAYDLVFRHALDVNETGDELAMGSTTGALWLSNNQGDSWNTVSTHLPPIHCVAFA